MMSEKPYPNNYNINKLKESQTKGASGELPAPYGKYQNVFLTESEYAELKQEYPDSLERLIEEMSRYIASSGNDYINHAAALYSWADRVLMTVLKCKKKAFKFCKFLTTL